MKSDRQFSLGYLFLIVFWFAVALGLARLAPLVWHEAVLWRIVAILAFTALAAGVGGIFREMKMVAAIAFGLAAAPIVLGWAFEQAVGSIDLP